MTGANNGHGFGHMLWHHTVAALVVAAIVTLLHAHGLLGWLDTASLRLLGTAQSGARPVEAQTPPASTQEAVPEKAASASAAPDVTVLLIGHEVYESAFGQVSPLNRSLLAKLITSIVQQAPQVLVIDLDLSPGGTDKAGQDELDAALTGAPAATRIVLALPLPVATAEARLAKARWLTALCKSGAGNRQLDFGLPSIVTHAGTVLDYAADAASIGNVAAGSVAGLCTDIDGRERVADSLVNTAFGASYTSSLGFGSKRLNFNGRVMGVLDELVIPIDSLTPWRLRHNTGLAGRAVFLGGAYSAGDRFQLPLTRAQGQVEGVVVHAAIYASARTPVMDVGKDLFGGGLPSFAIDVVIGVLAAGLFSVTWDMHERFRLSWEREGRFGQWLARRAWWVGNIVLMLCVVFVTLWAARWLYFSFDLWVNPGPIMLGIYVKFMLEERHELEAAARGPHSMVLAPPSAAAHRIEQGLLVCIVAWGLYTAATH